MIKLLLVMEIVLSSISHLGLAEALRRKMGRYRLLWWNYLVALIISIIIFALNGIPDGTFSASNLLSSSETRDSDWYFTCILFIGFATGIVYFVNYVTIQRAIACSGASTVNTVSRLGSFVIALLVSVLWGDHLTASNLVGVILACTAIFLFQDGNVQMSRILPILFVISGFQNILKKLYVMVDGGSFQTLYYLGIYTICLLGCSALLVYKKEKVMFRKGELLIGSVIGIASIFNTYSMIYMLRYLPVAIVTPVVSGGGILFTTFISVWRYKERISLKKGVGLAITLISIVFML